ncbi:MAG: primosomal protein N' [Bacilli bacterium]
MFLINVLVELKMLSLDKEFTYFSSFDIDSGVRVKVPFGKQTLIGFVMSSKEDSRSKDEINEALGSSIREIIEVIDKAPIISKELFEIANHMSYRYVASRISCLQTILPSSLKPKTSSLDGPKIKYSIYVRKTNGITIPKLSKKQFEVLYDISKYDKVLKSLYSPSTIKKLVSLNLIEEIKEVTYRYEGIKSLKRSKFDLTLKQQNIYDEINSSSDSVFLLKGVTGSGKTEIYIKLIEKIINSGKNAILLVPEINLTPLMKNRFISYFGIEDISILHSGLTSGQRYDEYRRIIDQNLKIVIGTRSAIFAPVKNLGLIIIDEEFSESYKNQDSPCYSAIEIAEYRAKINNCKLILGTATPDIVSMAKASRKVYHLLELDERYNKQELPQSKIINMNNIDNLVPGSSFLSKDLLNMISLALLKKEQVMLLINRRGYSNFVVCRTCNETVLCPKCGKPLIYHGDDRIICHTCGYRTKKSLLKCNECGASEFYNIGYGTLKIEEEINQYFPNAKIKIFDSDNAKSEGEISKILNNFSLGKIDILIGTQMIAKGHDFPNVSLVGILNADQGLTMPVFNAAEKTFQMITQTIGRTGRGEIEGVALVQTHSVKNYVIQLAASQNYNLFYEKEMKIRRALNNPPYFYVAVIKISSKLEKNVEKALNKFNEVFANLANENFIYRNKKVKNEYNYGYSVEFVLKFKSYELVLPILNKIVHSYEFNKNITIFVDVDPITF